MYLSEFSEVVKGTQGVKLLKCQHQGFVWRRVHEVKMDQIIYACQSNNQTCTIPLFIDKIKTMGLEKMNINLCLSVYIDYKNMLL